MCENGLKSVANVYESVYVSGYIVQKVIFLRKRLSNKSFMNYSWGYSSPHFPTVSHTDSIPENLSDYENGPWQMNVCNENHVSADFLASCESEMFTQPTLN